MYHFIINPHSKSGKAYQIWLRIEKKFHQQKIEFDAYLTDYPGHAKELATMLTTPADDDDQEPRTLIILGGDGTLNEVVNGLTFLVPITLGYIPTGSGNDFARSMRLSKKPDRVLKHLLNPKYHPYIDYGIVTYGTDAPIHRRFAVSCGIGYDASVCQEMLTSKLKEWFNTIHLGKLSYIAIGIQCIFKMKPCDGYIELDNAKRINLKKVAFISSHIQRYEGGGFMFAPTANSNDGMLDICVIANTNRLKVIPVLLAALFGKHVNMKGVQYLRCREAKIHMNRPLNMHTDGEVHEDQTDLTLSCVERRLRIIV